MMPQVTRSDLSPRTNLVTRKNSLSSLSSPGITPTPISPRTAAPTIKSTPRGVLSTTVNAILKPLTAQKDEPPALAAKAKAVMSVKPSVGGLLANIGLGALADLLGRNLVLELVSSEAKEGSEGKRIKGYGRKCSQSENEEEVIYTCNFDIPANFGQVGAVIVENGLRSEMYLNNIVLKNVSGGPVQIPCNSWVHSKDDNPTNRIFFTDKSYLPSQTPNGIKKLREQELKNLQGNGEGEREFFDRIYDFDKYNDLGWPDLSPNLARPVLGGAEHPYPRRCRTGRGPTENDPTSEERTLLIYLPRDENFSAEKLLTFGANTVSSALGAVVPSLRSALVDPDLGFPHFTKIDSLFDQGVPLPKNSGVMKLILPRLVQAVSDIADDVLLFDTPAMMERDKFSWLKDGEFSRQTLAGVNPCSIQLVTEWPMRSNLDPAIYGTTESAITKEIVETEIKGVMTLEEAMEKKKLFVMDYHDLLLPYVHKVRALGETTLYGSRTLFFQCHDSTLRPIAIELTRPPSDDKPEWRHVFTPGWDGTTAWLWKFAKAHVAAHDAGYHELVIHWLRSHCCTEPYIIAAHRQLSEMHPIFRLLHPHFRYTMAINSLAREALINASGVIELAFAPGRYSMELSSAAYDQIWRFDMEALPADLIRRGMAVEDPTAEHGLKLTIEDYPFANDGLILWDAIKSWVTDYVNHFYPDSKTIESDSELQAWWTEVRTKGHEDKKDEPWWPVLNTADSLIQTLSTIIWVASGHHAAVNFGQYGYGGYFPNRPAIMRTNVPNEDPTDESFKDFLAKPEKAIMHAYPSQIQATLVMSVLNVLSSHSPDEEYIGDQIEPSWLANPVTKAAFEKFAGKIKEMEGIVDARNADPKLRNRNGAGVVPYELLKPTSKPGVTGMGVPNSISI